MANEIYNTTWWGNAIDTAITAGTEPDFFGSQMKMLRSQQLGSELVTNGDFATDSNWVKGTGWTISGGKANCNGTSGNLYQSGIIVTGKQYKIQATISDYVAGNAEVSAGAVPRGTMSANGTYTFYQTAFSTSTFFVVSNSFIGSVDNVSVTLARAEEVEAVKCLADWIHTTALQDLNN